MADAPLHVVDGSVYFFRGLFGVPDLFFDSRDRAVNGVKGYLHFLFELLLTRQARHAVVAFDESLNTCFRNELYPCYKSDRPLPDENIIYQLRLCQQLTSRLGILTLAHARFEADDIIATIAARARRPVCVYSRDNDLLQLLRANVTLASPVAGVRTSAEFEKRFGFAPDLFPDYQALRGDSVDNIPGVPGVGEKHAQRLISRFGRLEGIYANVGSWPKAGVAAGGRLSESLLRNRAQAMLFRRLTRLQRRTPVQYATDQLKVSQCSTRALRRSLRRAGLDRHFARPLARLESF